MLAALRRSGSPYRLTPTALYQELVLTSGAMTHRVDALARGGLPGEDRRALAALLKKLLSGIEEGAA